MNLPSHNRGNGAVLEGLASVERTAPPTRPDSLGAKPHYPRFGVSAFKPKISEKEASGRKQNGKSDDGPVTEDGVLGVVGGQRFPGPGSDFRSAREADRLFHTDSKWRQANDFDPKKEKEPNSKLDFPLRRLGLSMTPAGQTRPKFPGITATPNSKNLRFKVDQTASATANPIPKPSTMSPQEKRLSKLLYSIKTPKNSPKIQADKQAASENLQNTCPNLAEKLASPAIQISRLKSDQDSPGLSQFALLNQTLTAPFFEEDLASHSLSCCPQPPNPTNSFVCTQPSNTHTTTDPNCTKNSDQGSPRGHLAAEANNASTTVSGIQSNASLKIKKQKIGCQGSSRRGGSILSKKDWDVYRPKSSSSTFKDGSDGRIDLYNPKHIIRAATNIVDSQTSPFEADFCSSSVQRLATDLSRLQSLIPSCTREAAGPSDQPPTRRMTSLLSSRTREGHQMTPGSQENNLKPLIPGQPQEKSQLSGFLSHQKQEAGPDWEQRQQLFRLLTDSRQPTPFEQKLDQKIQQTDRVGPSSMPITLKKSFMEAALPQQLYPEPTVRDKSSSAPQPTTKKNVSALREEFGAALNEFVHQLPHQINIDLLRSLVSHLKILHFDSLEAVQKASNGLTELQKAWAEASPLPTNFGAPTTSVYLSKLVEGRTRPTTSNPKVPSSLSLYQLQLDKVGQILDQIRSKISFLDGLAHGDRSPTSPNCRVDCLKTMVSLLENLEALEETHPSNVSAQVKMELDKIPRAPVPPTIRPITSRPQPSVILRSDSATKLKGINPAPSLAIPGLKSPSLLKASFLKPDIETLVLAIRAKHNLSGSGPSPRPQKEGGVGSLTDTKKLTSPRIPADRPTATPKGPSLGQPRAEGGVNNRALNARH